jgi:hypothetical protein
VDIRGGRGYYCETTTINELHLPIEYTIVPGLSQECNRKIDS